MRPSSILLKNLQDKLGLILAIIQGACYSDQIKNIAVPSEPDTPELPTGTFLEEEELDWPAGIILDHCDFLQFKNIK